MEVIQSLNAIITTTRVETIVAPNMNVAKRGVVIGFAKNLSRGLGGFSTRRNLNSISRLAMTNTRVVGTP
jgi:hypothetical protein